MTPQAQGNFTGIPDAEPLIQHMAFRDGRDERSTRTRTATIRINPGWIYLFYVVIMVRVRGCLRHIWLAGRGDLGFGRAEKSEAADRTSVRTMRSMATLGDRGVIYII